MHCHIDKSSREAVISVPLDVLTEIALAIGTHRRCTADRNKLLAELHPRVERMVDYLAGNLHQPGSHHS
jgi:hypothetical protein